MTTLKFALSALLAGGVAIAATSAEAKSCKKFGGSANMVTEGMAQFMAEAALKNAIANAGYQRSGKVDMKCKSEGLATCTAYQMGCK